MSRAAEVAKAYNSGMPIKEIERIFDVSSTTVMNYVKKMRCPLRVPRTGALQRFYKKFKTDENGCWIWQKRLNNEGYGMFWYNQTNVSAHRFIYEQTVGSIPEGMVMLHSCDVRACVNPNHLSVGTIKDNAQDMVRKGRHKHSFAPKIREVKSPRKRFIERRDPQLSLLFVKGSVE